jgi:peptidyl-prolyl cis-trans isomerase D
MLESLRAFSKTWVARILLTILVVSFGAFGINNVISDLGSNTVGRIGDQDITAQDFQRAYSTQINNTAQQLGKVPTSKEAMQMGIPAQVIAKLAADGAVNKFGQSLGFGSSDAHVAKMIGSDPGFANALGKFDQATFTQVLQQNGFTEAQYLVEEQKAARREQVALGIFGDAPISSAAYDIVNRYRSDTRTLSYFSLTSTTLPSIPTPTEADLTAYLKDHQTEYRTKETRAVDIMTLSVPVLAGSITVPDDQVAAEYEKTKAGLTKAETRDIKQAVLTEAQAAAFQIGQAAGKSFDEMVKAAGVTPVDIGVLAKSGISDSDLANAAFGLKPGAFVIIPGIGGKRAVTVTSIVPGGQISLADAKADIVKRLAFQQATTEVGDDTDQIEDLRAGKQPLTTIAPRYKLKISSVTLSADGQALSAITDIANGDRDKVSQAIFAAKAGGITPTVQLSNNQNVWFDLKTVTPARDQTLAEVHDAVSKAWVAEKTDGLLKAEANKIIADLKSGTSFDTVAAANTQVPTLSQPISRGKTATGPDSAIDGTVAAAAFNGGPGYFSYAVNATGDYVVFEVTSVTAASAALPAQTRTVVEQSVRDSFYGDFVDGLRQTDGLKINQAALNQALSLDPNGN